MQIKTQTGRRKERGAKTHKHQRIQGAITVRRHVQPGDIWREQRNVLQVDLHALDIGLYAVTTVWILLQDYKHAHSLS